MHSGITVRQMIFSNQSEVSRQHQCVCQRTLSGETKLELIYRLIHQLFLGQTDLLFSLRNWERNSEKCSS